MRGACGIAVAYTNQDNYSLKGITMGQIIAKFGEGYLLWSTSADGPITPLLTLPQLKRHLFDTEGAKTLRDFPSRISRVVTFGTSSALGLGMDALLENNHAGIDGKCVETEEEVIALFGPDGPQPGITPLEALDLTRPLVIRDPYAKMCRNPAIEAKVTKIIATHGDMVFAEATVAEFEEPVAVLFTRFGTIESKNFTEFEVVYDDA